MEGLKLKALEIQGFKSFADKTRLTFDKPVTCVVGPNGSGKSNIADAILWVTGEQSSKALRGGKMEDVIFGGTEKRRQMGYAEVSLILDNEDGSIPIDNTEVMITRRYYRSGESEYYINRTSCRLRDVNELLMDTGMGREGYSIIGQGRIDEILSAKSTDRRSIFEEAAGISRYRHRKEESERKLERTDENLVRVNDKISELALQVEPLREQAETAKKYLVLRDELRGIEISLWAESLEKLHDDIIRLHTEQSGADERLKEARASLEAFYSETEAFSEKMHDKDVEAEKLRELLAKSEAKAAEIDSTGAVLQANLESCLSERARVEADISEQGSHDESIRAQIEAQKKHITELEEKIAAAQASENEISGQARDNAESSGKAGAEMNVLLGKEADLAQRISQTRSDISALASKAQEMEDRGTTAAKNALEAKSRLDELEKGRNAAVLELEKAQKAKASGENVIKGYTMRCDARRAKASELEARRQKLDMDTQAMRSRIALLSEMEKEYQGYSKAVKTVMQEAQRGVLNGVHGTVAALIKVSERYTIAIETALGGAMQDIIVSREEDGKAAINLLKRRDAGRATFLPVSSTRGSRLNERGLENEEGFEGLAIDLVKFDEKFRSVFEYCLGRTAVCRTLDDAIALGRKYSNRFRIVTLDGQVMNAGGSMTGGSVSKNAGILSRANELENLNQRITELAKELEKSTDAYKAAKAELEDAQNALEDAKNNQIELVSNVTKREADMTHYTMMLDAANASIDAIKADSETLKTRIAENDAEISRTRKTLETLESEYDELKNEIELLNEDREIIEKTRTELSERLSELRAEKASLTAQREAEIASNAELETLRAGLEGGRERQLSYIESLDLKAEGIRTEIEKCAKRLSDAQNEVNALKERIDGVTEEKMRIEAERTHHNKLLQDKNNDLLNLERESARFEQKLQAAQMEENQLIDKLWDTYELTRSAAIEQKKPIENETEAKKHAAELKRSMSKLGNPNLGAIEEFDRVNTRYTYLTEQRDDIEKAKNELLEIITGITDEMRAIFTKEFQTINEQFKATFLELFGGGKANLELEDENDILNCGIEIKVQPPGKSLKTITLLSGGEKAFVAIALYFAVLKVRPAPFVVMDEIEAALDEANVRKFAEYMRCMCDKTQMVVITHRRGTMEEADVLYGVTMQEQGISRVLDIDLAEAEKSIVEK